MTHLGTFRLLVRFALLAIACMASISTAAQTLYTCLDSRGVPAGMDVAAKSTDDALEVARIKWGEQGLGHVPVKCMTREEWNSRFTGNYRADRKAYVCRSILASYPKEVTLSALPSEIDGYRKNAFGTVPNRCWPAGQVPAAAAPKTNGPFSDLVLGKYFNAIYNGDVDAVESMDYENLAQLVGQAIVQLKEYGPVGESIGKAISIERASLINPLLRSYLANYESTYGKCLRRDSVLMTYTKTSVRTGRVVDRLDYRINSEFVQAFNATFNAPSLADLYDFTPPFSTVIEGVRQVMGRYDCTDPVVNTFERRLLEMYQKRAVGG